MTIILKILVDSAKYSKLKYTNLNRCNFVDCIILHVPNTQLLSILDNSTLPLSLCLHIIIIKHSIVDISNAKISFCYYVLYTTVLVDILFKLLFIIINILY